MPDPDRSSRLDMPYLLPAQAQKHVTHNEALQILDAVVQLSVTGFNAQTPPDTAPTGQVHALGSAPTGAWAGQTGRLAIRIESGWNFVAPQEGWRAHDTQTGGLRVFRGGVWQPLLHDLDGIGIGTAPDATNRLAVSAPATLLSHAGDSHRVIVNKADPTDTASLLFQSDWSGRAEMGLAGEDNFVVKVSPDGATFTTALQVDRLTGQVTLPAGAAIDGQLGGTAVTQSPIDTTLGRVLRVGDFGLGLEEDNQPVALRVEDASVSLPSGFYSGPGSSGINYPNSTARFYPFINALRRVGSGTFNEARLFFAGASNPTIGVRTDSDPWVYARLYTETNILGTVGQSGGTPTGAVIERGSNANGEYVRFADGTQICTHTALLDGLSLSQIGSSAFYVGVTSSHAFPASFVSVGHVGATLLGSDVAQIRAGGFAKLRHGSSVTGAKDWTNLAVIGTGAHTGTAGEETLVTLTAIGRWF